jgi:hypothetical protein
MIQNGDTRGKLGVLRLKNEEENGGYNTVLRYEIWWVGRTALKQKRIKINRPNFLFGKPKWNMYIDLKTVLKWSFREENRGRGWPVSVAARSKT